MQETNTAPESAPVPDKQAQAPAAIAFVRVERPHRPSSLVPALLVIMRLFYPLCVLGSGVYLFTVFQQSGWLWLVLMFLVLAIAAKPREVAA